MTSDPKALARLESVVARLEGAGGASLLGDLVRDVWAANVARYDERLGDTVRVIAIQSAENIAQRAQKLVREDPGWRGTGIRVSMERNSMLVMLDEIRLHFVKAPQAARLRPDWRNDFAWDAASKVRADAARANDRAYRAPWTVPGMEPLVSGEGLSGIGNPNRLNEYFLIWAGQLSEEPLTCGWLVVPSLGQSPVIALQTLWSDAPRQDVRRDDPAVEAFEVEEPHVSITLKPQIAESAHGR
jgi:hypothetical protein